MHYSYWEIGKIFSQSNLLNLLITISGSFMTQLFDNLELFSKAKWQIVVYQKECKIWKETLDNL